MAIFDWPSDIRIGGFDYGIEFDVQIAVMRNGRIRTFSLGPSARWVCTVRFEDDTKRQAVEAMLVNLEGGAHRLRFGHFARPIPKGTLRGTPTLGAAVARGGTQFTIINANGGLKRGDIIGLPGQLFMVMEDADPVLTNLTVTVKPAARSNYNSGTPVTWNNPKTLWLPRTATAGPFPYLPGNSHPAFSVQFVEE